MRYLKLYEYFMFNNMELSYDYEKEFRERFVKKEFEDDDFLNIKEILERDCKKFWEVRVSLVLTLGFIGGILMKNGKVEKIGESKEILAEDIKEKKCCKIK